MPKPTIECSNCNQYFEAHYPYCPYCGQQAEDKLTLGVLFTNTINNYFSFDARFFRSFIPLMTKPGYLPKKFVDGKRMSYIHPAQMYLFISLVFFFLFNFVSREQAEEIDSGLQKSFKQAEVSRDSIQKRKEDSITAEKVLNPLRKNKTQLGIDEKELNEIDTLITKGGLPNSSVFGINFDRIEIDSMLAAGTSNQKMYEHMGMKESDGLFKKRLYKQGLKFYQSKSGGSILEAFYGSIPFAMFILLPIFALMLKLFYIKKGQFAHHLVFTFYFFSFLFTVFGILTLLKLLWSEFPGWIIFLTMLSTFFYLFFGVKKFYQQGYLLSFIKSNVISFLFLSLVIPFASVIMVVAAFLFY